LAKELDGQIITMVPATVGKVVADGTAAEEWKWLVEGIKEVYTHAEKAGIRIAIEPLNRFETYLINRGDQALALADAVGPNCGVCLDLFHMNIEENDIHEAFRRCKGRIYDVHIADNNRFAPGMGTLDFPAIVKTIKSTGYTGALTLEFVATIDRTPANPYGDQVETKPVDVSPEQMKFIIDHGSNLLSDKFYTGLFEQSVKLLRPLM
jgi:sugar phosphate isomerase/epimerase